MDPVVRRWKFARLARPMRGLFLSGLIAMVLWPSGPSARASEPSAAAMAAAIIPRPTEIAFHDGFFVLKPSTALVAGNGASEEAGTLAEYLGRSDSRRPAVTRGESPQDESVNLFLEGGDKKLGAEGYRLEITPTRILIRACEPAGLFYGVQTLRQLFPAEFYRPRRTKLASAQVPCLTIVDRPRFAWRGLLIDPARHFVPKEDVKKFIATMALHKLNSLQLHLTDDQGWRIEIQKYPKLTEIGAWRRETLVGHYRNKPWRFDGKRHGGFYSQSDIRELVAFARRHHVQLVPEIEMPGHAGAAVTAYPELSCFPDRPHEVWTRWGISPDIFNPSPRTIAFLQDVLAEVITVFPGHWIHIGGDEAIKDYWKESAEVQAQIRSLGLKNEEELQGWFVRQIERFVAKKGCRLIGWEEILQDGLGRTAAIMNWHGPAAAVRAAQQGRDVVMAPARSTYLDYYQGPQASEPLAIGGFLPLEQVYRFDPVPAGLSPEQARHILGAQGQVWMEYIPTLRQAEYMTWPRAAALAEVVWSGPAADDMAGFLRRLRRHLPRLDAFGIRYRPLD